jgi:TonB family protein
VIRRRAAIALVFAAVAAGAADAGAQQPPVIQAAPKLTKAPKLVHFVEAPFPESERAAGRSAAVVLQIAITAKGMVDQAIVKESAGPAFDAAAVEAAKQFVFEPAEIDGKPAAIRILYRYEFTLKIELPKKGTFVGTIRERGSKKPMPLVTVELGNGQRAVTDAAGRFRVDDVPPGKQSVIISSDAGTPVRTEETFAAGEQVNATYDIEPKRAAKTDEPADDLEIVVQAPPLEKQVVTTKRARCPAPKATFSRSSRTCPASGGHRPDRVSSSSGAQRRKILASISTAFGCRFFITSADIARW